MALRPTADPGIPFRLMNLALFQILIVGLGGMLGGIARFWVADVVSRQAGAAFPWGTLFVNVSGSLAIGLLAAILPTSGIHGEAASFSWLVFVVGILGSYTTVSAFSLQTLALFRDGRKIGACLNIIVSLALCLVAVGAGYLLGSWLVAG